MKMTSCSASSELSARHESRRRDIGDVRYRASAVFAPVRRLGETRLGVWTIKHLVAPLDRRIYRLTGGRRVSTGSPIGPILLLTTTGRRTGKEHTTPVFYLVMVSGSLSATT